MSRLNPSYWVFSVLTMCVVLALSSFAGSASPLSTSRTDHTKAGGAGYDEFGGILMRGSGGTGAFRVEKVGSRWVFLDPAGHPFWMRAVYAVDWADGGTQGSHVFQEKYNGDWRVFAEHAARRLKQWGFNALGEYASPYLYPVPTFFRTQGNSEKLPFIRLLNISWHGALNHGGLAPGPFKTLLAGGVDPAVYKDWPGHVPDVFDPNFEIYARNLAADRATAERQTTFTEKTPTGGLPLASLDESPWLIGTSPDDSDYLFGFGPGPEAAGRDGVIHPHIGWVIAVTRPKQNENTEVGSAFGMKQTVTYRDPIVYSKQAWRNFLKAKYGTISRLNAAWGSSYTTFDSDGGWPRGHGLMDESGHNSWIGRDAERLSTASPAVAADLDTFLGMFAERYFQIVTAAIRAATPHHLVFGPSPLDSHAGLTRKPILIAAGRFCDVLQVDFDANRPELVGTTYAITQKPEFVWVGFRADASSAVQSKATSSLSFPNQSERAEQYRKQLNQMLMFRTPGGISPLVGLDWWEYMDKPAEGANWGLVTPRDNAYDGKEDVPSVGKDSWNFVTGREPSDYGDFLSTVELANRDADKRLRDEMGQNDVPTQAQARRAVGTR